MLDVFIFIFQHVAMKFTSRPHRKPTWASENNVAVFKTHGLSPKKALERVGRNNKIARILIKHGWNFTEGMNMTDGFESYYSLAFRKPMSGITLPDKGAKYTDPVHPWVFFNFRWDNQGGPEFMVGEMYGFYSYARHKPYMKPSAQFEIKYIPESHLKLLDNMYNGVVAAIKSQVPSYGDADDIE